jgi:hypothetical protein
LLEKDEVNKFKSILAWLKRGVVKEVTGSVAGKGWTDCMEWSSIVAESENYVKARRRRIFVVKIMAGNGKNRTCKYTEQLSCGL